jgi:hypothetical protein
MTASPAFDHIAVTVPDVEGLVDRLTTAFGMIAEIRSPSFAVVVDPGTALKLELTKSEDGDARLRHFGFRADDVDGAYTELVEAGMEGEAAPHRRDFAAMYTAFLRQPDGVEIQLVKYD